jgi:hypothetical protein
VSEQPFRTTALSPKPVLAPPRPPAPLWVKVLMFLLLPAMLALGWYLLWGATHIVEPLPATSVAAPAVVPTFEALDNAVLQFPTETPTPVRTPTPTPKPTVDVTLNYCPNVTPLPGQPCQWPPAPTVTPIPKPDCGPAMKPLQWCIWPANDETTSKVGVE